MPPPETPSSSSYAGNTTVSAAAACLRAAKRAVVVTHAKPDGDAVGSSLGIARLLLALGAVVEVWLVGPYPNWLDQMAADTPVRRVNTGDAIETGEVPDLVVVADTGSWVQVDCLRSWLEHRRDRVLLIDHHLNGDPSMSDRRLIDPTAAATAQIVARVAEETLGNEQGAAGKPRLPRNIAEPLYLGLATDTGWFKYSNVTPDVLRVAAHLMECGTDAPSLYEMVEQQSSPTRPLLLGRALESLKYERGGAVAVMCLTQADFAATRAEPEDTGGFAEHALAVAGVSVVAVLTETTNADHHRPLTKVSLRSKPGPHAVDVARACASLGGGGHARAAGVKLKMRLEEARAAIMGVLP